MSEIFKAINAVQAEMAKVGISKDKKNQQQGFMFRGIDDVYSAIAPLLARCGLVILPRVLSREESVRQTAKGGLLYSVVVNVEYTLGSIVDGSTHVCNVIAEAMDSGDKATNKAMSASYKYLALQTFCIPTVGESPDADEETHPETRPVQEPQQIDTIALKECLDVAADKGMDALKAEWMHMTPDEKKAVGGAKALEKWKATAEKVQ